ATTAPPSLRSDQETSCADIIEKIHPKAAGRERDIECGRRARGNRGPRWPREPEDFIVILRPAHPPRPDRHNPRSRCFEAGRPTAAGRSKAKTGDGAKSQNATSRCRPSSSADRRSAGFRSPRDLRSAIPASTLL